MDRDDTNPDFIRALEILDGLVAETACYGRPRDDNNTCLRIRETDPTYPRCWKCQAESFLTELRNRNANR